LAFHTQRAQEAQEAQETAVATNGDASQAVDTASISTSAPKRNINTIISVESGEDDQPKPCMFSPHFSLASQTKF
jgi:hypothetical protein